MTIGPGRFLLALRACGFLMRGTVALRSCRFLSVRSEEHTSELQSRSDLVCRLLLEKKKKILAFMSVSASIMDHSVFQNHYLKPSRRLTTITRRVAAVLLAHHVPQRHKWYPN